MTVRLIDIAKRLGVSPQAVSKVVNQTKSTCKIGSETQRQIKRVARELGYYPNAGARSIKKGRFGRVAFVVTRYVNKAKKGVASPGYLEAAVGFLAEKGFSLIYEPFDLDYVTSEFIDPPRLFSELAVDGILALDSAGVVLDYVDRRLTDMGAPVVWINRAPAPEISTVVCDERQGARLLTRHLLDLGHRRIGYLGPEKNHYSAVDRFEGVFAELQQAGVDTGEMASTPRSIQFEDAAGRLLQKVPQVSAVICYNHLVYEAVLHMACRLGRRVPENLSLCYFDSPQQTGIELFSTCLDLPEMQMAITAAQTLLSMIEGKQKEPITAAIPGILHLGKTTGPPGVVR
jgi:DNA-binding LacI/PurR family transcriptional regulator